MIAGLVAAVEPFASASVAWAGAPHTLTVTKRADPRIEPEVNASHDGFARRVERAGRKAEFKVTPSLGRAGARRQLRERCSAT